ncbi:hypothetical protein AGMMS50239_04550 [Bacteroidia bacterium]|nr:hypothetical protein AGMMS50239_04550 [Bacteroidia bacterium]
MPAKDTPIYDVIVSELQKNPELAADYDMATIEISVKKKITPRIQDIDKAITNLKQYIAINKEYIQTVDDEAIVVKKDIIRMLKISRPTFDKWIKDGFITHLQSKHIRNLKIYPPDLIMEQLRNMSNTNKMDTSAAFKIYIIKKTNYTSFFVIFFAGTKIITTFMAEVLIAEIEISKNSKMLELKNIHKSFGDVQVLNGINLRLEKGCVYTLKGGNGKLRIFMSYLPAGDSKQQGS